MIDMARWMLGEITDVHARLATVTRQENPAGSPAANDLAHLSLEHAGGALSSVVAGGASPTHEWLVTVVGRDGTLAAFLSADALRRVQGAPPYWVRWRPHTDNSFQEVPIADDLWEGALRGDQMSVFTSQRVGCRLFVDAILRGERVEPSFRDGWEVQQVMDAALRSQAEGLTVAPCDPRGAVGGRAR
jgi:predicted dehydrogenase